MNIQKLIIPVTVIMVMAIIVKVFILPGNDQKPKLAEIKDQVYVLMADLYCEGKEVTINLKKAEIDEFTKGQAKIEINGWPVRINAKVICDQDGSKYTQKFSLDDPAFFVRKTLWGYEVFLPEALVALKDQVEDQLKGAAKS